MDGVVIGWGWTNKNGGSKPSVLQEVSVPIMPNEDCRARYEPERNITSNMMCAVHPNGGKDACQVISKQLFTCKFLVLFSFLIIHL